MSNGLDPDQDRHSVGPDGSKLFYKGYQQTTLVGKRVDTFVKLLLKNRQNQDLNDKY